MDKDCVLLGCNYPITLGSDKPRPREQGMDKLLEFRCFLQVAATGSFTAAASLLNITPSAASKQVKSLEERLGVRLFNRTTRHVSLTEVGQTFRDRIEPVLGEVDEAEQAVTQLSAEPRGRLRISS